MGFQRAENDGRLDDLATFFHHPRNVIQNPLLCARRDETQVKFVASDGAADDAPLITGQLEIEWEDLSELSLLELLKRVKGVLESRVPGLAETEPSDGKLADLKQRAQERHPDLIDVSDANDAEDDVGSDGTAGSDEDSVVTEAAGVALSGETHIADFWEEVAARAVVLGEVGESFDEDEFLGFSKEAMVSYLQPVVVVDGQHRLGGSLRAAMIAVDSPEHHAEVEHAIENGESPDEVRDRLQRELSRVLPISLLLETSAEEHVFQFVVVNQKATPIGKALLGTIVSTSLASDELERVSQRLVAAGIPLEDSQAIAYLTRHPDSPFKDLVDKGLAADRANDLLQWNVLRSLVRVFRELQGGRLDHEQVRNAEKWRRDYLEESAIVAGRPDDVSAYDYWQRADGPWRDVFIRFWLEVRDRLGTVEESDREAGNFWGSPRTSNLFNKVTLNILAADFFQFLIERKYAIDNIDDIERYVEEWLDGVKTTYFSRDWKLTGVKKDSPGVRSQWAFLWNQYRKDPQQVPSVPKYRVTRAS